MNPTIKKVLPHIGCIAFLLAMACIYFSPVLSGKSLLAGDTQSGKAMSYENTQYYEATGQRYDWNSSMFSGMPTHQGGGGTVSPNFISRTVNYVLSLNSGDIGVFFFYLVGFYIALICLGFAPLMALLGAVAFGLGSYNIIIILAGHVTKARCVALMMPIFAGMMLCFRSSKTKSLTGHWPLGEIFAGLMLFTFALVLQISNNHIQITYYTMLGAFIMGIVYLIYSIKEHWFKSLAIVVGLMLVGCVFAIGCNARMLFLTQEYAKYTMRGGSEISVTPDDLYHEGGNTQSGQVSSGLDLDYAYSWSYDLGETYTLLVPGSKGGGSSERVGKESACYKNFRSERMPLYWGQQPFTDGPVYFGAIIIFLFVLGLFIVKGPERWWLLFATLLSIMLAWGRHFMPFNEWMFNYLPFYNKFRTPSMALTLASVTMVFMAVLTLKALVDSRDMKPADRKHLNKALYIAGGIMGGIILIGLLVSGGLSYSGTSDQQMAAQYKDQWPFIQNIFIQDRKALFVSDSWRSLIFIALAFGVIWLYVNDKFKKTALLLIPLAFLIVVDLWGVDRRYLAEDNFVKMRDLKFQPEAYDIAIDQMAAAEGDVDYRVFNLKANTYNDAKPAVFHHQIGGYSAVKLRRYQDLIDFYMSRRINWDVINMLNARYIVVPNGQVQRNPDALGNVWFVRDYRLVPDANAEILALNDFNPAQTAIVDSSKWASRLVGFEPQDDPTATIVEDYQSPYCPGYLRYTSHSEKDQLAVFSEVFYEPDWFAYIDGKPAEYFRVNYILRGMIVPAGDHVIEFKDEAPMVHKLNRVNLWCQIILLLGAVVAIAMYVLYSRKKNPGQQLKRKQ
ncbi:MAG: hypothetical protein IJ764_01320 [Bacteroidales bacterium]|nr:hypothetical protein [Bacteroidales bacterium]